MPKPQAIDLLIQRPDWHKKAACQGLDPALFFPRQGESNNEAKAVCQNCPVRWDCEEQGVAVERFGVWGGMSERERRRIRRARTTERTSAA